MANDDSETKIWEDNLNLNTTQSNDIPADEQIDSCEPYNANLGSKDLMKEFKTNVKAFHHSDSYFDRMFQDENKPFTKLSTIKYFRINKVDIEKIMHVKEIYLILKKTIECCD